ncbi:hypothetical protein LJ753_16285 [Arthrobacter sp. zg-Y20]|uniref:hypothetical protein n=1 Tax=unclassified Arthrobacter TaxID=235627 RepID=UPI001D150A53|nr:MULTISPECIES: hypothetical protein [unclassified Arthrobacter]MCC3277425.1 hypothetical protein [Arthrobacter sp. zg-Y20]MDK1317585.1 hypothetical protein [Arthrobacter sp. zg.Y20]WIB06919.1 hypothetical protein QNO06_04070 [Arthrobacter sp. zg-Y20]
MERLRDEPAPITAASFEVRQLTSAHRTEDGTPPTGQEAVAEVRDGVLSAARGLRHAALTDDDEQRENVADWVEAMFNAITDEQSLCRSAAKALELYRGGAGGFADYGSAVMAEAGHNLGLALIRGRDFPET